ncbi:MAG: 16S rRNA (cytosine(1402)-N(4))-methyltransferase RsmH [Phycisphaerales bacterium]
MPDPDATPLAHTPVLLREVLDVLSPRSGDTVLDCTAGLGGHAEALAHAIGPTGSIHLFDLDPANLAAATSRLAPIGPAVHPHHASFHEAPRRLAALSVQADVVLADLGFSSNQIDTAARGFAFSKDGPLDMRLDPTSPLTAAELVNTLSTTEIAAVLREFGEEPAAHSIAEKITRERTTQPITTTGRLAEIVRHAVPHAVRTKSAIHPATRTFQALRIAVNDELGRLGSLLDAVYAAARRITSAQSPCAPGSSLAASWLARGARIGIISFHSLEDRPVKRLFAKMSHEGLAQELTRKPLTAGDDEIAANPRSRSAKFRACRIGTESDATANARSSSTPE